LPVYWGYRNWDPSVRARLVLAMMGECASRQRRIYVVAESARSPLAGLDTDGLLHVMTYNLRFPADDPGHLWEQRRPVLAELLSRERPDVLGTQEGHFRQVRDVAADLPSGYEWIGEGRSGGSGGEFMAIFYDAARLTPLQYAHLWLSDTPEVIGSTTWGNGFPRMATWVRFSDAATGTEFVVVNTHLDNHSENARVRAAGLLAETVESFSDLPVIVTGDFNAAAEDSEAYRRLVTETELGDAWLEAKDRRTPAYATFAGYQTPAVGGNRIDWILTTPDVITEAAAINPFAVNGEFASDHLPVQALLRLPG
jgi:endonuclease/exonuclease/phosphatase family metal-dependent hydrolase